jgi:hypothetical protein
MFENAVMREGAVGGLAVPWYDIDIKITIGSCMGRENNELRQPPDPDALYGGIEAGGTKFVCAVGDASAR